MPLAKSQIHIYLFISLQLFFFFLIKVPTKYSNSCVHILTSGALYRMMWIHLFQQKSYLCKVGEVWFKCTVLSNVAAHCDYAPLQHVHSTTEMFEGIRQIANRCHQCCLIRFFEHKSVTLVYVSNLVLSLRLEFTRFITIKWALIIINLLYFSVHVWFVLCLFFVQLLNIFM